MHLGPRLKASYAFTIAVCVMLTSCMKDERPQTTATEPAAAAQTSTHVYTPGMGDLMSALQLRHAKLWYAGEAQNWELAAFELHEIEETFERVTRWHPHEDGVQVAPAIQAHMQTATLALERGVAQQDWAAFETAFDEFTRGCNGCHQMMQHDFIVIRRPLSEPVSNQEWRRTSP